MIGRLWLIGAISFVKCVVPSSAVRQQIGGVAPNNTVEIDESLFGKRKNNVGRIVNGQWILGGIHRTTGECFLEPVNVRNAATLLPIIQNWVLPGTTIITDEWRAYRGLTALGYNHQTINHSLHFVDPQNDEIHTQTVESMWHSAKRKFKRMCGTTKILLPSYLDEYAWRCRYARSRGDAFQNILTHIAEQYPV